MWPPYIDNPSQVVKSNFLSGEKQRTVVHLHSQDRKTRGYLFLKSISDDLLNINCMQSCFAVVKIIVRFLP